MRRFYIAIFLRFCGSFPLVSMHDRIIDKGLMDISLPKIKSHIQASHET